MSDQPTRRANIRRTIKAIRQGTPERAPLRALRGHSWPRWVAGMRHAAIAGTKTARDLERRPAGVFDYAVGQNRLPKRPAPPEGAARMAKRTTLKGKGSGLPPLRTFRKDPAASPFYRRPVAAATEA